MEQLWQRHSETVKRKKDLKLNVEKTWKHGRTQGKQEGGGGGRLHSFFGGYLIKKSCFLEDMVLKKQIFGGHMTKNTCF